MAYLNQIRGDIDKLVINSLGHCYVLTPMGAVYDSFATDDLTNMTMASANLFESDWRRATDAEFVAWDTRRQQDQQLLKLQWNVPRQQNHPRLRVVK